MTENPTASDQELTSRILAGDNNLYGIIVQRYNQRLYKIGIAILNDRTEVEDAMQTAYINAFLNLEKFQSKSSFATWLTRIMVNECSSRLKKNKNSIDMTDHLINDLPDNRNNRYRTPMSQLLHSELGRLIDEAICRLPENYRIVFVMRELENMSVAETQQCLGISAANVKVRLNRAKVMLRIHLLSYYKRDDLLHFHRVRCDTIVANTIKALTNPGSLVWPT